MLNFDIWQLLSPFLEWQCQVWRREIVPGLVCVAPCCTVLHRVAPCCTDRSHRSFISPYSKARTAALRITLQHTVIHCYTHGNKDHIHLLSHTATHCNTLQHIATHCYTHGNKDHIHLLSHTATHFNTLQHTATRMVTSITSIFSLTLFCSKLTLTLFCSKNSLI